MKKKCVLAYSGGLDTSVILGWLIEQGYDVVAVYVDLWQPCEDRQAILEKARNCGAVESLIVDVREELCRDFAFPTMQWQARYEGTYLLGTSIARPLISKVCVEIAHRTGATVYAHGATGKGNDQCRFQLAAEALDPGITVLAPWRLAGFRERFPGRQELIEFCDERKIPVKASKGKPYSSDENCLHTSYEAGLLEELTTDGLGLVDFGMTVSPQEAPDRPESLTIEFETGVPVRVNGKALPAHEIVLELNAIGGRNGIGRTDIVENRLVGMKSRGVYEAPGMTLLYEAHRLVEQMTLDRDLVHLRDRLAPEVAEMVYYGFWYCAKMDALMAFIREAQRPVSGVVRLDLYKGNMLVKSRESGQSLYDAAIASMEGGGSYDQTDAEGFLRILGLPLRVQGRVRPRLGPPSRGS
jgi:argininosuccinate synthase